MEFIAFTLDSGGDECNVIWLQFFHPVGLVLFIPKQSQSDKSDGTFRFNNLNVSARGEGASARKNFRGNKSPKTQKFLSRIFEPHLFFYLKFNYFGWLTAHTNLIVFG